MQNMGKNFPYNQKQKYKRAQISNVKSKSNVRAQISHVIQKTNAMYGHKYPV